MKEVIIKRLFYINDSLVFLKILGKINAISGGTQIEIMHTFFLHRLEDFNLPSHQ